MASVLDGPGDQNGRRLVLRQIQPDGLADVAYRLITGAGSGESDQAWELADPWGAQEGSSAALAVTRRVGDMVMLLGITVNDGAPPETIRCLVQQLVATLRRTDAAVVCSSVDDEAVREELLAAGFVPLPEELDAAQSRTPAGRTRIILQL
jgi:hypothetical protein